MPPSVLEAGPALGAEGRAGWGRPGGRGRLAQVHADQAGKGQLATGEVQGQGEGYPSHSWVKWDFPLNHGFL